MAARQSSKIKGRRKAESIHDWQEISPPSGVYRYLPLSAPLYEKESKSVSCRDEPALLSFNIQKVPVSAAPYTSSDNDTIGDDIHEERNADLDSLLRNLPYPVIIAGKSASSLLIRIDLVIIPISFSSTGQNGSPVQ